MVKELHVVRDLVVVELLLVDTKEQNQDQVTPEK
jgi:hypothetical protein